MNTEFIIKTSRELEGHRKNLKCLNEHEVKFELRVFSKANWEELNYKPETGAIRNMVVHQIRMELQNKIRACKDSLREATRVKAGKS